MAELAATSPTGLVMTQAHPKLDSPPRTVGLLVSPSPSLTPEGSEHKDPAGGVHCSSGDADDAVASEDRPSIDRGPIPAVSLIAKRSSMLPKPEVGPKPAHLMALSPIRFAPTQATAAATSPPRQAPPNSWKPGNGVLSMVASPSSVPASYYPAGGPTFDMDASSASDHGGSASVVGPRGSAGVVPRHQYWPMGGFPLGPSSSLNCIPLTGGTGTGRCLPQEPLMPAASPVKAASSLEQKAKVTASMLKSTLKRMSRLSLKPAAAAAAAEGSPRGPHEEGSSSSTNQAGSRSSSPFSRYKVRASPPLSASASAATAAAGGASGSASAVASSASAASDRAMVGGEIRKTNSYHSLNRRSYRRSPTPTNGPVSYCSASLTRINRSLGPGDVNPGVNPTFAHGTDGPFKLPGPVATASGAPGSSANGGNNCRSLSRSTSSNSSSSGNLANVQQRSHSLKRSGVRSRETTPTEGRFPLQRSGSTAGSIMTQSLGSTTSIRRSNSTHQHHSNRRFRDRDLNVKYSRGVQTQLTKDAMNDDCEESANEASVADGNGGSANTIPTKLDFSIYFPSLLGEDTGDFETFVSESTDPVDVRRNRQLQLDNMKLHREIEKLKSSANEADNLKRELRLARARLEDEQRTRARIEHEMDKQSEEVKLITQYMDNVERGFEAKDSAIKRLEADLVDHKTRVAALEKRTKEYESGIQRLNDELDEAREAKKTTLRDIEVAELEARELQEFLQAEKFTMAEALKDSEAEIASLKGKVGETEERCGHLVRLGEQRHQEILALEAQLQGVEDRAKEMLLSQGAEMSRGLVIIADIASKMEESFRLLYGKTPSQESLEPALNGNAAGLSSGSDYHSEDEGRREIEFEECLTSEDLTATISDLDPDALRAEEGGSQKDGNGHPVGSEDMSLHNLSKAIELRRKVSEGHGRSPKASSFSLALVDRLCKVNELAEKVSEAIRASADEEAFPYSKSNGKIKPRNGHADLDGQNGHNSNEEKASASSVNGGGGKSLSSSEAEIAEIKAKFLKHRQILAANYQQSELEVMRLDDIFHDTVNQVLEAFGAIPDIIESNETLKAIRRSLQTALLDEELHQEARLADSLASGNPGKSCSTMTTKIEHGSNGSPKKNGLRDISTMEGMGEVEICLNGNAEGLLPSSE